MTDVRQGLGTAADVLRQLISLSTANIGAALALLWANKSSSVSHWWPFSSALAGGLCIFAALLFLTDLAAEALGSKAHSTNFRYCLFIVVWVLFLVSVGAAALYLLLLAKS